MLSLGSKRKYFGKIIERLLIFPCFVVTLTVVLSLLMTLGYIGLESMCSDELAWLIDLSSHFALQYVVMQVIACLIVSVYRYKKLALIFLFGIMLNLIAICPYYFSSPRNVAREGAKQQQAMAEIKLLHMNLLWENSAYAQALALIEEYDPDVVSLQEYSPIWDMAISSKLKEKYPHNLLVPMEYGFGIALYSKLPIAESQSKKLAEGFCPPAIISTINASDNKRFKLVVVHGMPPFTPEYAKTRNEQFKEIAHFSTDNSTSDIVVIGDFNCTPWTYRFKKLLRESNLIDSQYGFGVEPTWHRLSFPLSLIRLPIDHCLVSKNIEVLERQVGRSFGSDHYPVFVRLKM